MMIKRILLVLFFVFSGLVTAAPSIEILDLHHRTADELIPVLRPLLSDSESITGTGYQLIVKAYPETIQQLQTVLNKLDQAPHSLLLTVSNESALRASGYHIDGGIVVRSGDSKVIVGQSERRQDSGVTVRGDQYSTQDSGERQNQLRITEGKPAFILRENLRVFPARAPVYHGYGNRSHGDSVYNQTFYSNQNGVYVTARVIDNENVNLDISPVFGNDQGQRSQNRLQTANTTLRAKVGEWIYLGGTSEQSSHTNSGIISRTKGSSSDSQQIYVKVEIVQ